MWDTLAANEPKKDSHRCRAKPPVESKGSLFLFALIQGLFVASTNGRISG